LHRYHRKFSFEKIRCACGSSNRRILNVFLPLALVVPLCSDWLLDVRFVLPLDLGYWMFVLSSLGPWLLVIGYWIFPLPLSFILGYSLFDIGCSFCLPLDIGYWLLVIGHPLFLFPSSLDIPCSTLDIRFVFPWTLVIGCWLLDIPSSSFLHPWAFIGSFLKSYLLSHYHRLQSNTIVYQLPFTVFLLRTIHYELYTFS
jgi:hypothetical protein